MRLEAAGQALVRRIREDPPQASATGRGLAKEYQP
jgi:hypothetical protein